MGGTARPRPLRRQKWKGICRLSEDSQDDAASASPGVETQIAEGAVTALQATVLALCSTINALDGFDILAISFTAADIAGEWSLAPDELGMQFSGGLIGMMIGAFAIAPLAVWMIPVSQSRIVGALRPPMHPTRT